MNNNPIAKLILFIVTKELATAIGALSKTEEDDMAPEGLHPEALYYLAGDPAIQEYLELHGENDDCLTAHDFDEQAAHSSEGYVFLREALGARLGKKGVSCQQDLSELMEELLLLDAREDQDDQLGFVGRLHTMSGDRRYNEAWIEAHKKLQRLLLLGRLALPRAMTK